MIHVRSYTQLVKLFEKCKSHIFFVFLDYDVDSTFHSRCRIQGFA